MIIITNKRNKDKNGNLSRKLGQIIDCSRPSILGNYPGQKLKDRDEQCDAFDIYLDEKLLTENEVSLEINRLIELSKYVDITLSCWCYPLRCHTMKIKRVIDEVNCFKGITEPDKITSMTCYLSTQTIPITTGNSGYGFYIVDNQNNTHRRYSGVYPNVKKVLSDNLFAQVYSLINLLEYCNLYENLEELTIYSENVYMLRTLKGLITNKTHDDKFYKEQWDYILTLISKYKPGNISFHKSNPKDDLPMISNQLASYGRMLSVNKNESISLTTINDELDSISKPRKKELESITIPGLISGTKWFFLTDKLNKMYKDYYMYTTLSFEKVKDEPNFMLGTDAPDDHIGIILSKEPINVLESIRERLVSFYKDVNLPAITTLNLLSKIDNKNFLLTKKDLFTTIVNNKCSLKNGTMISEIINPPLKAFNLIHLCESRLSIFNNYLSGEIESIDITNHFFTKDIKDKLIIKPTFTNDTIKINIPIQLNSNDLQVSILPNIDFPKRNNFVKMLKEEANLTIKLLYWDVDGKFLTTMIVIETTNRFGIYFTSKASKKIAFS